MLQKISMQTNVLTWFEIPVTDMARAKKFYETILNIQMHAQYIEETQEEMAFFTFSPGVIQASSGRVSGVLVKNNRSKPSMDGTLVYLNASPNIDEVITKIEPAGGKLLGQKLKIAPGYIAVFMDTEGNKVALHAEE